MHHNRPALLASIPSGAVERGVDFEVLLAEIEALCDVGHYPEAIERAKFAVAQAPGDPRPLCLWSQALYGSGAYREAEAIARQAVGADPSDARGYRLLSVALSAQGRLGTTGDRKRLGAAAVESSKEAVRLAPHSVNGYITLAAAYSLTKEIDAADAALVEAMRLAPNEEAVWITASQVALSAHNWERAIEACERALAIDPNSYAALNNLGAALSGAGKKREATTVWARAAKMNPNAVVARRNISRRGIFIARLAIMLILLPIGFAAHVGTGLYFVFAIASNIFISKNPEFVMRMEGWAAPVALLFAKRSDPLVRSSSQSATSRQPAAQGPITPYSLGGGAPGAPGASVPWSTTRGHYRVRSSLILVITVALWITSITMVVYFFALRHVGGSDAWVPMVPFLILAIVPTIILLRRRRRR